MEDLVKAFATRRANGLQEGAADKATIDIAWARLAQLINAKWKDVGGIRATYLLDTGRPGHDAGRNPSCSAANLYMLANTVLFRVVFVSFGRGCQLFIGQLRPWLHAGCLRDVPVQRGVSPSGVPKMHRRFHMRAEARSLSAYAGHALRSVPRCIRHPGQRGKGPLRRAGQRPEGGLRWHGSDREGGLRCRKRVSRPRLSQWAASARSAATLARRGRSAPTRGLGIDRGSCRASVCAAAGRLR